MAFVGQQYLARFLTQGTYVLFMESLQDTPTRKTTFAELNSASGVVNFSSSALEVAVNEGESLVRFEKELTFPDSADEDVEYGHFYIVKTSVEPNVIVGAWSSVPIKMGHGDKFSIFYDVELV